MTASVPLHGVHNSIKELQLATERLHHMLQPGAVLNEVCARKTTY